MQSKQLSTTPVLAPRRLHECLATEAAQAACPEIEQGLQYGTEWLWNGVGPMLTTAGVRSVADQLDELGHADDAERARDLANTMAAPQAPAAPAPATVRAIRPPRSHLPYADADDETIFASLAANQGDYHARHH